MTLLMNPHAMARPIVDPEHPQFLARPNSPKQVRWLFERSTEAPVTEERIAKAREYGLHNAEVAAKVCREVGVSYARACALFWVESRGENVWGNDVGGFLSGFVWPVNIHNFRTFDWAMKQDWLDVKSNGCGPSQITYYPYFAMMAEERLRPWIPYDNMLFGLRLLNTSRLRYGGWRNGAAHYNGGTRPTDRAYDYADKFELTTDIFRDILKGE